MKLQPPRRKAQPLDYKGWVRLTQEEHASLKALADRACRDLSGEIRIAIRKHLAEADSR